MAILGQQIGQVLCDALGLPKHTRSFVLRCEVGQLVTVECEYYPADFSETLATALAEFHLEPVKKVVRRERFDFDSWMQRRTNAAHEAYMQRHARGGISYT